MIKEHFYFLTDDYCDRYETYGVMKNKEIVDGVLHNRPCFYAVQDDEDADIFWMIPISSQISKYQAILQQKLQRYPVYDGLEFGYVRGRYAAFLIQNICPVRTTDVIEEYIDVNTNQAVVISNKSLKRAILNKAKKVISLTKKGMRVTQTDAYAIYKDLKNESSA